MRDQQTVEGDQSGLEEMNRAELAEVFSVLQSQRPGFLLDAGVEEQTTGARRLFINT